MLYRLETNQKQFVAVVNALHDNKIAHETWTLLECFIIESDDERSLEYGLSAKTE